MITLKGLSASCCDASGGVLGALMVRKLHETSHDDLLWLYPTFGKKIFFSSASALAQLA